MTDRQRLQINQALFSIAHAYASRMAKEPAAVRAGLTLSDRALLMVLGQFEPTNGKELSRYMDMNPGTISLYVQSLVEKGLVRRDRDSKDRRKWWLALTDKGKRTYRETISGTVRYTQDFVSALEPAEQKELHRLLLKTSHALGYYWQ